MEQIQALTVPHMTAGFSLSEQSEKINTQQMSNSFTGRTTWKEKHWKEKLPADVLFFYCQDNLERNTGKINTQQMSSSFTVRTTWKETLER